MSNNHGLDIALERAHSSDEDWVFGSASSNCRSAIPLKDRLLYLPQGETQRAKDDTMDCASRAPVNILEAKFNHLIRNNLLTVSEREWLVKNGYFTDAGIEFSDAYIAILSGTTQSGNSLKAPLQAIHDYGLIPKKMLPLVKSMTFAQYMNTDRITDEHRALGAEFLKRFPIFYEKVYTSEVRSLLENDLLDVAGYAWPVPDNNGIYQRQDNQPNHAFVVFGVPEYQAFDNYPETEGDYVKHLAPDYGLLDYGYRVYIGTVSQPETIAENEMQDLIDRLWITLSTFFKRVIQYIHA